MSKCQYTALSTQLFDEWTLCVHDHLFVYFRLLIVATSCPSERRSQKTTSHGLLVYAYPAALRTDSMKYEYKACLKLLISSKPYPSHTCHSLLPVSQRTQTVKVTIKRATWPIPISPASPNPSTDGAVRSIDGCAEPYNSFGSVQDPVVQNRMSLVQSLARPIFLTRTDDSHCGGIHSSPAAVHCFDNGYMG